MTLAMMPVTAATTTLLLGRRGGPQQLLQQSRRMASFYDKRFKLYAARPMHQVKLEHLVNFDFMFKNKESMLLQSANFLRSSLPTRLARRILDVHALPYICGINPYIQKVHDIYVDAFNEIVAFPQIQTLDDEKVFYKVLQTHLESSRNVLPALAKASNELATHMNQDDLTAFLDTMIESRIGRRVLAEQHIAFHEQYYSPDDFAQTDIGSVSLNCDGVELAHSVFNRVRNIAKSSYACAPTLEITTEGNTNIPYIPRHLEYMLLELFKNAVRATIEHHLKTKGLDMTAHHEMPPVHLFIFSSETQSIFRISDKGGGIPPSVEPNIWKYAFTTIGKHGHEQPGTASSGFGHLLAAAPMAGEGFGLPMARVYARYFGGDLTLQNIPNFGAEMFLKLKHLDRAAYVKRLEHKLQSDSKQSS